MAHSFKISQSALNTFRNCPYAYKMYREKKDAIFFNPNILDTGKLTHDAIDIYYKQHYLSKATPEEILAISYGALRENWDTTLPPEELKKSYDCLFNHAKWEAKNTNGIQTKPLTEVKITNGFFFGILDYISLENQRVIDFKTNTIATLNHDYSVQAIIYKSLYETYFSQPLKEFSLFFLYPNEIKHINFNSNYVKKVAMEVETLKNEMLKCIEVDEFPKNPRTENGCSGCIYRLYCKF